MMDPREREAEKLEDELADCDNPAERKAIQRELRELHEEIAEENEWRDEGHSRGWH